MGRGKPSYFNMDIEYNTFRVSFLTWLTHLSYRTSRFWEPLHGFGMPKSISSALAWMNFAQVLKNFVMCLWPTLTMLFFEVILPIFIIFKSRIIFYSIHFSFVDVPLDVLLHIHDHMKQMNIICLVKFRNLCYWQEYQFITWLT